VNSDHGFVVYKTLVGFESVFPPAWEDDDFDLNGENAFREQRIDEFVAQITDENAEEWFSVLQRCAQTESNDLATFPSFGEFLEKLSKSKPSIVMGYLDRLEGRLANFLPGMLSGLEQSELSKDARTRVRRWIEHKIYLQQIIHHLRFTTEFDAQLLQDALKAAIEIGDNGAVVMAVAAAHARHGDVEGGLIDRILMPALAFLGSAADERWVNVVWPRSKNPQCFVT
jgi:hypothetical protein